MTVMTGTEESAKAFAAPDSAPHQEEHHEEEVDDAKKIEEAVVVLQEHDDDHEEKRKRKSISEKDDVCDVCDKKRQKETRAYAVADELVASWCAGEKARFKGDMLVGDMLVVERCATLIQKIVTETIRYAPSSSEAPSGEQAEEALATSIMLAMHSEGEGAFLNCDDNSLSAFAARVEILYALFGVLKTNFDETVFEHLGTADQDVLVAAFQGDGECDATAALTAAVGDQVRTAQFAYGCMIYGDNSDFFSSFVQLGDDKDFIYKPDFNAFASAEALVSSIIKNLDAIIGHVEDVRNETTK